VCARTARRYNAWTTTLDELGPRICILGPSNSGKSTLAAAIGRVRGRPPIHLDQLFHLPNTNWAPRPEEDFIALHDAAITGEGWVMEGNSRCMKQRFARATGIILLDSSTPVSLFRYRRRSWFERNRHGALAGGKDSVKWLMIRYIVVANRAGRRRAKIRLDDTALPQIRLMTPRDIDGFYRAEGLSR
jgi:adenylate kinase family enzyme